MTPNEAYTHASNHRREIEASTRAGCFHCLAVFPAGQVANWVDGGETALCPRCGVDAVLGDRFPGAVKPAFLELMRARWFTRAR